MDAVSHRADIFPCAGIFFDDLNDRPADQILAFSTDAVNSVVPSYLPLVSKHKADAYTEEQKQWQQMRRGRWEECGALLPCHRTARGSRAMLHVGSHHCRKSGLGLLVDI